MYRAENILNEMLERSHDAPTVQMYGSTFTLPIERKFASVESIQTYVDAVLALNWVRKQFPRALDPVAVRVRKGQEMAYYERWNRVIAIPVINRWAMREMVVLHELAHHLSSGGHGKEFIDAFVVLVSELMGTEAGFILRGLFYDEGVGLTSERG